jgi:hypothetical protein
MSSSGAEEPPRLAQATPVVSVTQRRTGRGCDGPAAGSRSGAGFPEGPAVTRPPAPRSLDWSRQVHVRDKSRDAQGTRGRHNVPCRTRTVLKVGANSSGTMRRLSQSSPYQAYRFRQRSRFRRVPEGDQGRRGRGAGGRLTTSPSACCLSRQARIPRGAGTPIESIRCRPEPHQPHGTPTCRRRPHPPTTTVAGSVARCR